MANGLLGRDCQLGMPSHGHRLSSLGQAPFEGGLGWQRPCLWLQASDSSSHPPRGRGQTPTWVPIRQGHFLDVTLGKSISLNLSPLNNTCLTRVELNEVMCLASAQPTEPFKERKVQWKGWPSSGPTPHPLNALLLNLTAPPSA